jgi:hypothetical protein
VTCLSRDLSSSALGSASCSNPVFPFLFHPSLVIKPLGEFWNLVIGIFLELAVWNLGFLVFIALVLAPLSCLSQATFAPQYTAITPGLDYAHLSISNQPWSIHIARWNRSHKDLALTTTLGQGTIQGLNPLSKQAQAIPAQLGHPLAAVNGDFFLIKPGPYQGDPEGLQIINGELVSTPGQISFWVRNGEPQIGKIQNSMQVTWPDGSKIPVGLNQTPRTNTAVLFTPIFGHSTRATNMTELVLENSGSKSWLPLRADQTLRARIRSLNTCGDSPLSSGAIVLTLGSNLTNHLASAPPGSILKISTSLSRNLSKATAALGGGPLLVHAGHEQTWPVRGTNQPPRNPRTALGYSDRYLFLVEVDGRQPELSLGMSFPELASLMKNIGCTEAMNLDGGGSSTFWLDGHIMNSPSDKHERPIANALFIIHRP